MFTFFVYGMTDFLTCEAINNLSSLTINILFHRTKRHLIFSFVSYKNVLIEYNFVLRVKLYNYQKRYEYKYIKLYLDYKAYFL